MKWFKTESISGTISVSFEVDSGGNARRKTKVTQVEIEGAGGPSESQTVTEIVERLPMAGLSKNR